MSRQRNEYGYVLAVMPPRRMVNTAHGAFAALRSAFGDTSGLAVSLAAVLHALLAAKSCTITLSIILLPLPQWARDEAMLDPGMLTRQARADLATLSWLPAGWRRCRRSAYDGDARRHNQFAVARSSPAAPSRVY